MTGARSDRSKRLDSLVSLALARRGPGAVQPSAFVYRPGGTSAGNIFASWSALMAAVGAAAGIRTILIDASLSGGNAHVPAGIWNVDNCEIYGQAASGGTDETLTFDEGAQLTYAVLYLHNLAIVCDSTVPVVSFAGGRGGLVFGFFIAISSNAGKAAFIRVASDSGIVTVLGVQQIFLGDGVTPVIQIDLAVLTAVEINLSNHSTLFANATTGAGSFDLVVDPDSILNTPQGVGQILLLQGKAQLMRYQPATLANWSGAAPTSVANALDRIAAKIAPIP